MTQERALNSDSFSVHDDVQDFSHDHIPALGGAKTGSDSPEFGYSGYVKVSDPMLIDDKMHNVSPDLQAKGYENKKGKKNNEESTSELKEKLKAATKALRDQQEEYKGQLLHIETISMMTKYQLVFIKMESALIKVAHIMKNKDAVNKTSAFLKVINHSKASAALRKYKTQLIYHNLKENTEKLAKALSTLHRGNVLRAFKAIWFTSKAWKNERAFKEEKEKYVKSLNDVIVAKDKEIIAYNKKLEELNNIAVSAKSKESEYISKLKHKEKQISTLEIEKADLLMSKKSASGDTTAFSIRSYEEKIRDLQQKNEDLKERLSSAESNVGTFIREMSELLDSHESSINIVSDENASFHNHENDDEYDSSHKIKDKNSGQSRGKEAQGKALAQRTGYQPPQNRYPKAQQINYCYIQYDNPSALKFLETPNVISKYISVLENTEIKNITDKMNM